MIGVNMEETQPAPQSRPEPTFIDNADFVRVLRMLRAAAPMLIGIELIAAFESDSATPISIVMVAGSVYIVGSAAYLATLTKENKDELLRKAFKFFDDAVHADFMTFRLASSLTIVGVDLVSRSLGPVVVPSWVIGPLQAPAVVTGILYAITQYRETNNQLAKLLGGILLAAQMSRLIDTIPEILAVSGIGVSYLVRTIGVIASMAAGITLKLLENGRPNVQFSTELIKYISWGTYPLSVFDDNVLLKSLVWPAVVYTAQALAAAAVVGATIKITYDYRNTKKAAEIEAQKEEAQSEEMSGTETETEKKPDVVADYKPLFPKKTEVGCLSRLRAKVSNFWSKGSAPSESSSLIASAQKGSSAETYLNSKSPSLNSSAPHH